MPVTTLAVHLDLVVVSFAEVCHDLYHRTRIEIKVDQSTSVGSTPWMLSLVLVLVICGYALSRVDVVPG